MTRLLLLAVLVNAQGALRPEPQPVNRFPSQPIAGFNQPASPVVMVPQVLTNSQGMQFMAMVPMPSVQQPQFGQPIGMQQAGILQGSEIPQRLPGMQSTGISGAPLPPLVSQIPQAGQFQLGTQPMLQSGQFQPAIQVLPPLGMQEGIRNSVQGGKFQAEMQPQSFGQTVQLPVEVSTEEIDTYLVPKETEPKNVSDDQEQAPIVKKGKKKQTQKVPLVPVIPVVETNTSLPESSVLNASVANVTLPTDQGIVIQRQALRETPSNNFVPREPFRQTRAESELFQRNRLVEQQPFRRNRGQAMFLQPRQVVQGDSRCEGVRTWTETFFQRVRSWIYDRSEKGCGILNLYFDENTTFVSWVPVPVEANEICSLLKHVWAPSNFTWKIKFVNDQQGKAFGDFYISGKIYDNRPIPEGLKFQFVIQFDQDTCKVLQIDITPLESQAMFEMSMTPPLRHLHDLMRELLKEGTRSEKFKQMFSPNTFVEVPNLYRFFLDRNYRVRIDELNNSEVFKAFDFDNSTLQAVTFPFASEDKAVTHIVWDKLMTKNGTALDDMEFWVIFDFECKMSKVTKPAVMFSQLKSRPPGQPLPTTSSSVLMAKQSCDSTLQNQFCQDGTPCNPKYLSCEDPKQCKCPRYFPNGTQFCDSTLNGSKCEDGTPCSVEALNCSDPMRCECPLKDRCNVTGVTLLVNRPLDLLAASPKFKFNYSGQGTAGNESQTGPVPRPEKETEAQINATDGKIKNATKDIGKLDNATAGKANETISNQTEGTEDKMKNATQSAGEKTGERGENETFANRTEATEENMKNATGGAENLDNTTGKNNEEIANQTGAENELKNATGKETGERGENENLANQTEGTEKLDNTTEGNNEQIANRTGAENEMGNATEKGENENLANQTEGKMLDNTTEPNSEQISNRTGANEDTITPEGEATSGAQEANEKTVEDQGVDEQTGTSRGGRAQSEPLQTETPSESEITPQEEV